MSDVKEIITLDNATETQALPPDMRTMHLWCAYLCAVNHQPPPPSFDFRPQGEVLAYVNHGRWVADCPFCSGAMLVSPRDPLFWCVYCRMEANNDWPMACVFPLNRADIEQTLLMRPALRNRNWFPEETVDRLVRENLDHQVRGVYKVR